jgi:nucleoid-associated protein YgaU
MKPKYASVLKAIAPQQVRLSHLHIQDNKLFIQGAALSDQAKNKVGNQIKQVNPSWSQELSADISVDANAKPAQVKGANVSGGQQRTCTVKAGDSLSKISTELYGNANEYMEIFEADRAPFSKAPWNLHLCWFWIVFNRSVRTKLPNGSN